MAATRSCRRCGAEIGIDDRYCHACGRAVGYQAREQVSPAPPQASPPPVPSGRPPQTAVDEDSFIPLPTPSAPGSARSGSRRSRFQPTPRGWLGLLLTEVVIATILSSIYLSLNPDDARYGPIAAAVVVSSVVTLLGWVIMKLRD